MDANLIYVKTALGDEAMQNRSRLPQRELRTVLILVDGKSTVGELCEKTGNPSVVENGLDQLERGGFIETIAGHASEHDIDKSSEQIALIFDKSATRTQSPASHAGASEVIMSSGDVSPAVAASERNARVSPMPDTTPPAPSPAVVQTDAIPGSDKKSTDAMTIADLSASLSAELGRSSAPDSGGTAAQVAGPFAADDDDDPVAKRFAKKELLNPFAVPGGAEISAAAPEPAARPADVPLPRVVPLRRRKKFTLGWKGAVGIVGGVLLFLLVLVFAYPVASHRADMESALSRNVGQPVTIGAVRSALNPLPVLILENVRVGSAGDLTIREIRATPQPFSLFGKQKVFSSVDLSAVTVPVQRLGMLAAAVNGVGAGGSNVIVRRMKLNGITFAVRELAVQEFAGLAEMDDAGKLRRFDLGKADGTLRINVQGQGEGGAALVTIEGNGWKAAEGSPFVFDALLVQGVLTGTTFAADKIEGRLLGGVMNGRLVFDWSTGMALEGSIGSDFMPTKSFLTAFGSPLQVDGEISGRLRFKAAADSWAALMGRFPIEGDFVAKKGTVNGMDLVESVRRAGKVSYRGGVTKFDQLSGRFGFDGQTLQLSNLDLSSGVVHAGGRLVVGKGQTISGVLDVLLRGTAVGARMPVSVSGPLKEPVLTAGRR